MEHGDRIRLFQGFLLLKSRRAGPGGGVRVESLVPVVVLAVVLIIVTVTMAWMGMTVPSSRDDRGPGILGNVLHDGVFESVDVLL